MNLHNSDQTESLVIESVQHILETDNTISSDQSLELLGLNSIMAIKLILYLEDIFDIQFNPEDLVVDNFSTIKKIIQMVKLKENDNDI